MAEPVDMSFALQVGTRCPLCEKAPTLKYQPFCSKRCADRDLHRWLSGAYALPSQRDEEENDGISTQEA